MAKVEVKLEVRNNKENKPYHVVVFYYDGHEFDTLFPSKPIKALLDLESQKKEVK
jgi:hypothetical protein